MKPGILQKSDVDKRVEPDLDKVSQSLVKPGDLDEGRVVIVCGPEKESARNPRNVRSDIQALDLTREIDAVRVQRIGVGRVRVGLRIGVCARGREIV